MCDNSHPEGQEPNEGVEDDPAQDQRVIDTGHNLVGSRSRPGAKHRSQGHDTVVQVHALLGETSQQRSPSPDPLEHSGRDRVELSVDADEDDFIESDGLDTHYDSHDEQDHGQNKRDTGDSSADSYSDEGSKVLKARRTLDKKLSRDPSYKQAFKQAVQDEVRVRQSKRAKPITPRTTVQPRLIKSPSDTTLYTPALKKGAETNQVINQISDFVDEMQLWDR